MSIIKDLTGLVFGSLTVVYRNGSTKQSRAKWNCKCECGNVQDFISSNLLNGHSVRCKICANKISAKKRSNVRRVPVSRNVMEQIVAEYYDGETPTLLAKKYSFSYTTIVGWIEQLGMKRQVVRKKTSNFSTAFNIVYKRYKASAKYRELDFNISKDEFFFLTQQICYYCGSIPSSKSIANASYYVYNGIDRKNNSIGYIKDNIAVCCGICNRAKHMLPVDDFEKWIANLINFKKTTY